MRWDALAIGLRHDVDASVIIKYMKLLEKLGLFEADEIVVANDACPDVGSAGSTLNTLLIAVERLCAKRGFTVLTEEVLFKCRILIVLVGLPNEECPLGRIFGLVDSTITTSIGVVSDSPLVRAIQNTNRLASNTPTGVFVCGTDTVSDFAVKNFCQSTFNEHQITAFTFLGHTSLANTHGVYRIGNDKKIEGLAYCSGVVGCDSTVPIVLAQLYLPPKIAVKFLALHLVHPIASSAYYGIDSGAIGLKLSLFFDFILATCTEEADFVGGRTGGSKIDVANIELIEQARRKIHSRFRDNAAVAEVIPVVDYQTLGLDYGTTTSRRAVCKLYALLLAELLGYLDSSYPRTYHSKRTRPLVQTLVAVEDSYLEDLVRESSFQGIYSSISKAVRRLHENREDPSEALHALALVLAVKASAEGGLRSGPAANPAFLPFLRALKEDVWTKVQTSALVGMLEEVERHWMSSPMKLIRAARHLEAAAQVFTTHAVKELCTKYIPKIGDVSVQTSARGPAWVVVDAPARIDFFGGWLDTPPITLKCGRAAVVNMAVLVDGNMPLRCKLERTGKEGLEIAQEGQVVWFGSTADVWDTHKNPSKDGCLVCACLVAINVVQSNDSLLSDRLQAAFGCRGIRVETHSSLPHGSGLGTSSILASAVVAALFELAQTPYVPENVVHTVLLVEQLLTTGGGWQDQVGGIYPGLKTGYLCPSNGVQVRPIAVDGSFEELFNHRLVLIYTDKTRLAKNLLQEFVRNWYEMDAEVCDLLASMMTDVVKFEEQLSQSVFDPTFVDDYYTAKKKLATGCEPTSVARLIGQLRSEGLSETAWLAGAGGGGFLVVYLKEHKTIDDVARLLVCDAQFSRMTVHAVTVSKEGLRVRRGC